MKNSSPRTGRAEWRFPGIACVLRCDQKTLLQPRSRLKPTNIQVDTDLLRLVNRQVGRLNAAVSYCSCRDFADCVRNRLCAGNVQSTVVAG